MTTRQTRTRKNTATSNRPKRVPMSGSHKRMHVDEEFQDPNFHYAWINDQKDLIFRAKRAGFEHVTQEEMPLFGGVDVDAPADRNSSFISMPVGHGTIAYLMKQPMEYYEEDRAAMDAIVDGREGDLKKSLNSGNNGTYGNVDIDIKKRS